MANFIPLKEMDDLLVYPTEAELKSVEQEEQIPGISLLPFGFVEEALTGSVLSEKGPKKPVGMVRQILALPEVALSMLAKGEIAEPIIGLAGLNALLTSKARSAEKITPDDLLNVGWSEIKSGFDLGEYSAEEANKVMEDLRNKLYPYLEVRSEAAKASQKNVAQGVGQTVEPVARFGREMFIDPAAKTMSKVSPEAAGVTGAILSTFPEFASIYGVKAAGLGWKGTKKGFRKFGDILGVAPDVAARYSATFRKAKAAERASIWLRENLGELNEIDAETARWLEDKTGIKLDLAGFSKDPKIIRSLNEAENKSSKLNELLQARRDENLKLLQDYLASIKTWGDPQRLVEVMRGDLASRGRSLELMEGQMTNKIRELMGGQKAEQSGRAVREAFKEEERLVREHSTRLFEDIQDDLIDVTDFVNELTEIIKPKSKSEVPAKVIPIEVRRGMKSMVDDGNYVTAWDLYRHRQTWTEQLRDMYTSPKRNRPKERRMVKAIDALDRAMQRTELQPGVAAEKFREARRYFYENWVKRFDTNRLRRTGRSFDQSGFVSDAQLAGLFWKTGNDGIGAAQDFKKAAKFNTGAYDAMKAYINDDLLHSVYDFNTKEVSSSDLSNWLNSHRKSLEEFGWLNEYDSMFEIQKRIDDAHMHLNDFQKLRASKMLAQDPGHEMRSILESETPARDALEIIREFGGTQDIKDALKNTFIDQILEVGAESVGNDKKLTQLYKKMEPVYKVLFANEPEKMRALAEYREALIRIKPEQRLKGGFDTMGLVFKNFFREPIMARRFRDVAQYTLIRMWPDLGKEKIRQIIYDAALDPEFAYILKKSGKDLRDKKPETVARQLKRYFLQVGKPAVTKAAFEAAKEEE